MRRTPVLLRQHIGWHFTKHWVVQGKRKPLETGAEKILKQKGIPVYKPEDIIGVEKKVFEKVEVIGYKNKPLPLDETHPNWHDRKLLSYKDSNVLLEGLSQAKVITNTVEVKQGLPESITLKEVSTNIHKATENIILNSQLLDAEQKKLPKVKDPTRPAWNFPRTYGITQFRRKTLVREKQIRMEKSSLNRRHTIFSLGEKVWVKDYRKNAQSWCKGRIHQVLGGRTYIVEVDGGITWKRHTDQLKKDGSASSQNVAQNVSVIPRSSLIDAPSLPTSVSNSDNDSEMNRDMTALF